MSYFEESVEVVSVPSGIEFTATNSSRFVTLDGTGRAVLAAANAVAYGVMTTNQPVDAAGRVAIDGIVPVEAGATVTIGQTVGALANGLAGPAATTKLGIARTAGASGDVIAVDLRLPAVAAA